MENGKYIFNKILKFQSATALMSGKFLSLHEDRKMEKFKIQKQATFSKMQNLATYGKHIKTNSP